MAIDREHLVQLLRTELPRLLRDFPEVRHEVWGIFLEAFPSRQEFTVLLEELRAFREEVDRRFEAMVAELKEIKLAVSDMKLAQVLMQREMRDLRLEVSALSGRLGHGLEYLVKGVIEEFSGQPVSRVEPLTLIDEAGELYGVPGAQVEFDLFASNGTAYLVEVKSHLKASDVLGFHRKVTYARERLGRPLQGLVIAASMTADAEELLRRFGVTYIVRSRL
jgi:hypothetical protein